MTSGTTATCRPRRCRIRTRTRRRGGQWNRSASSSDKPAMLKHRLIHPKINEVLGRAGHHAKVLIADGNYPASSTLGPRAEQVSLNLMPGVVNCTQVLEAVLSAVPVERANTMMYEETGPYALAEDPPVWAEYRRALKDAGLK